MRFSIGRKLAVLIVSAVVMSVIVTTVLLVKLDGIIYNQSETLLRNQIDTATSIVNQIKSSAADDPVSQSMAKQRALEMLSAIRYAGNEYVFVLNTEGKMLVNANSAIIGSNMLEQKDANGFAMIQHIVDQAVKGGGVTSYLWERKPGQGPEPKLSYSEMVPGWNWVLGTGLYTNDVQALFWSATLASLYWTLPLVGLLILIALPLARSISRPVNAMVVAMQALARGDTTVEILALGRNDEIGEMATTLEAFRKATIEHDQLTVVSDAAKAEALRNADEKKREDAIYHQEHKHFTDEVTRGFDALSGGDLTVRLEKPFADEYEGIRTRFNQTVETLEETMLGVVSLVGSIQTGLAEITTAANDLSQRTEEQAANLEETVAALGEVTNAVQETSVGAGNAQGVANSTHRQAEKGGEVVGRAVIAMQKIEQSSQKISRIIGVIDEIAFQTNLLALNAGVEAARAGDAGRGFAVVAQEVRGLAQRSADAAKEIKELISLSGTQVEEGVTLVSASGQSLSEIVERVAEMSVLVATIAKSASEQATSLFEVSTAADQMDKVTQQNAAMVEQTTAAAQTLMGDTATLFEKMSIFRMTGSLVQDVRAVPKAPRAGRPSLVAKRSVSQVETRNTTTQLRTVGRSGAAPVANAAADRESWEEF